MISDVNMPVMDGIEATRRIRELPGLAGRVPIIALTGSVMSHEVEACRAAGMQGHLAKPIDPDRLMDLIDRMSTDAELSDA